MTTRSVTADHRALAQVVSEANTRTDEALHVVEPRSPSVLT
jgi:hypothetical protein